MLSRNLKLCTCWGNTGHWKTVITTNEINYKNLRNMIHYINNKKYIIIILGNLNYCIVNIKHVFLYCKFRIFFLSQNDSLQNVGTASYPEHFESTQNEGILLWCFILLTFIINGNYSKSCRLAGVKHSSEKHLAIVIYLTAFISLYKYHEQTNIWRASWF